MNYESKTPIANPSQLLKDGQLITLKYIDGAPLNYRFNASSQGGNLNFEGMENANLTKKGASFSICPIGFRAFVNRKFGREKAQTWVEIFFLNVRGQVGCLMFHSASGENFLNISKLLAYDDLKISDIKLNITPRTKTNKDSGNDYYICEFDFEELKNEERLLSENIVQELGHLYRRSTIDTFDAFIASENYPQMVVNACGTYDPTKMIAFQPDEEIKDPDLLDVPSNPKGVKKAA